MSHPSWRKKNIEVLTAHAFTLKKDPVLGKVVRQTGPIELRHAPSPFHALARAIVSQQISVKAAQSVYGKLTALVGGEKDLIPENVICLEDAQIRSAGLSSQKTVYLKDLSAHALDGRLPLSTLHKLDDDEVAERLVAVRGLGVWSAHMFLMFHLARPDIWPVGDLGLREALGRALNIERPTPKDSQALGDRWLGKRTTACWYLWRSLEGEADAGAIW